MLTTSNIGSVPEDDRTTDCRAKDLGAFKGTDYRAFDTHAIIQYLQSQFHNLSLNGKSQEESSL